MDISAINGIAAPNFLGGTVPLNATQANVEAAGLLLYLNNLVGTYGAATPKTTDLHPILIAIIHKLQELRKQYSSVFSSEITAGIHAAFLAYKSSQYGGFSWGCFVTTWGNLVDGQAIITDAQSQIQDDSGNLLPLPTSGGGVDAAYLFGLSMVENSGASANFFAGEGASIYAAATVEFFQDAGIAAEAAAFPITSGGGTDEGYFLEDLEKYETDGSPYTNKQINTMARTLLQQYINSL